MLAYLKTAAENRSWGVPILTWALQSAEKSHSKCCDVLYAVWTFCLWADHIYSFILKFRDLLLPVCWSVVAWRTSPNHLSPGEVLPFNQILHHKETHLQLRWKLPVFKIICKCLPVHKTFFSLRAAPQNHNSRSKSPKAKTWPTDSATEKFWSGCDLDPVLFKTALF